MRRAVVRAVAGFVGMLLYAPVGAPALAHPILNASAVVAVSRAGDVEFTVRHDALAFALNDTVQRVPDEQMIALVKGPREDLDRALEDGRERFVDPNGFAIRADGAPVDVRLTGWPTSDQVEAWGNDHRGPLLPIKLEFAGRASVPRGTKRIALKFPRIMGEVVLTVQSPGEEPRAEAVQAGEWSSEFGVRLDAAAPASVSQSPGGAPAQGSSGASTSHSAGTVASASAAWGFLAMGFHHIVGIGGLDHILFVLGLFFLQPRVRPLLVQVTAFTVAHSVTLLLCARGVVTLPTSIVEPAIAASIAFIAIENLCTQKVHVWRVGVVFLFGLVHGLGFASSFAEAMRSETSPLGPVVLFNLGVELGQLTIVGLALLAVGWFAGKPWYRNRIAIPASIGIALCGLGMVVTRLAA